METIKKEQISKIKQSFEEKKKAKITEKDQQL